MNSGGRVASQAIKSASMAEAADMISHSLLNVLARISARKFDSLPIIMTSLLPCASAGRRKMANFVHSRSESGTRASRCKQLIIYRGVSLRLMNGRRYLQSGIEDAKTNEDRRHS